MIIGFSVDNERMSVSSHTTSGRVTEGGWRRMRTGSKGRGGWRRVKRRREWQVIETAVAMGGRGKERLGKDDED